MCQISHAYTVRCTWIVRNYVFIYTGLEERACVLLLSGSLLSVFPSEEPSTSVNSNVDMLPASELLYHNPLGKT